MKRFLALLALVPTLSACEPSGQQPIPAPPAPPELICPLSSPAVEDPGPIPAHDPIAAATPPNLDGCGIATRTVQRLNRTEYNHTVRDLFLVDVEPADEFPVDDTSDGFDNQGDALSLSPLLFEKLDAAARTVVDAALSDGTPRPTLAIYEAEVLFGRENEQATVHRVIQQGGRSLTAPIAYEGDYRIRVRAYGEQAGGMPVVMEIRAGPDTIGRFEVTCNEDAPEIFEATTHLLPGPQALSVHFMNDYMRPQNNDEPGLDRNLVLDYIEIEGPFDAKPGATPAARTALLTCDPEEIGDDECAREIVTRIARRAFRGPVDDGAITRLTGFVTLARAEGGTFEEGLKLALRAILLSPRFLFRSEAPPAGVSALPQLVDNHALASRLSYFFWSSMPDDRLLELADRGALTDPAVLEAEARRMVRDPKSRALVESFAGQWLMSRAVDNVLVDVTRNPDVDADLLRSMRCETELLVDDVLRSGAPLEELLLAESTFVNEPLAEHYGVDAPEGEREAGRHPDREFGRVSIAERKGMLMHAGVLAIGAHPNRSSPVKRGKWVLENVLCMPPEPPPPGVEGLPESPPDATTQRELLAIHRENPMCASCHNLMDPLGLAFENFDEVGRYRTTDNGEPVDASGLFLDLHHFDDGRGLVELIAEEPMFTRCATEKAMTYALGRRIGVEDTCAIDAIVDEIREDGLPFEDLFVRVALSAPFRMQRTAPDEDGVVVDGDGTQGGAE